MLVASWNVNSVKARLPNVLDWLGKQRPDVLLLQELKCTDENFPEMEFQSAGYQSAVHGQKSWNGVAILSRHQISHIGKGLPGDDTDAQARYIEANIGGFHIASLYAPNGNPVGTEKFDYKLAWLDRLYSHAQTLLERGKPVVLGGDFNIIPEDRDCHDPKLWAEDALFRPESRRKFRTLLHLGLSDAFRLKNDQPEQYTFWDYQAASWQRNAGIRIDHFLLSSQAVDKFEDCFIDAEPRGRDKASDHTPILLKLT